MSYEERNAWTSLVASLFAWGIIGSQIMVDLCAGVFAGADGIQLWAWAVVKLILWGMAALTVLTVVVAIVQGIIRKGEAQSTKADERDQLIALLSHRIVLVSMSIGVIGAIVALSQGIDPPVALTGILLSCAIGDTIGTAYRVWRYRRGF
jgi:hypothetical protein